MKLMANIRFGSLFIHLLLACCIFLTKYENIARGNLSPGDGDANTYVNSYLIVSVVMLSIQILLSILGFPQLLAFVPLQMLLQIVGVFCYACFILLRMNYLTITYMWAIFCLIPFLVDLLAVIGKALSNKKYQQVSPL